MPPGLRPQMGVRIVGAGRQEQLVVGTAQGQGELIRALVQRQDAQALGTRRVRTEERQPQHQRRPPAPDHRFSTLSNRASSIAPTRSSGACQSR